MPRVTILMPAYNASRTVSSAIDSALRQTFVDLEVVVIDDGSTDDTCDVVERIDDPRVRLLRQANAGPSAARNRGAEQASGDLLGMLDADDLWLPTYLDAMVAALDAVPTAAFAWNDAWVYDEVRGQVRATPAMTYQHPPARPPSGSVELLRELVRRNFVYGSTTVRRSVFLAADGYDGTLSASEDYDLWLRILTAGHGAVRVEGDHAVYRRRPGTNSDDPLRVYDCMARMYERLAEDPRVPADVAATAVASSRLWRRRIEGGGSAGTVESLVRKARRTAKTVLRPERWLDVSDSPAEVREVIQRALEIDTAGAPAAAPVS